MLDDPEGYESGDCVCRVVRARNDREGRRRGARRPRPAQDAALHRHLLPELRKPPGSGLTPGGPGGGFLRSQGLTGSSGRLLGAVAERAGDDGAGDGAGQPHHPHTGSGRTRDPRQQPDGRGARRHHGAAGRPAGARRPHRRTHHHEYGDAGSARPGAFRGEPLVLPDRVCPGRGEAERPVPPDRGQGQSARGQRADAIGLRRRQGRCRAARRRSDRPKRSRRSRACCPARMCP